MVVLKIETQFTILWSTWDDYRENIFISWPQIAGRIYKNEIAIILEIYNIHDKIAGVKIYTQRNSIGWICPTQLSKIMM